MHINFDLDIMIATKYLVREICDKNPKTDVALILAEKILENGGESLVSIILYNAIKSNHLAVGSKLSDSLGILLFERSSPGSLPSAIAQKMTIDKPPCTEGIAWFDSLIFEHLSISAEEWEKECFERFTVAKNT